MATLFISIARDLPPDTRGTSMPVFPGDAEDVNVTFTTAAQSGNLGPALVRLYADADFHLKIGTNPTATATSPKFSSGTEYFRWIPRGWKLSVYDGSS